MLIDSVDLTNLDNNAEEAFITFEQRLREGLEKERDRDRNLNSDHNGEYSGSYAPERFYVSSVLAFLDEYNLELDVPDITEVSNRDFQYVFSQFFNKINYAKTRFSLRKNRISDGVAGTLIQIAPTYKAEIGKLLETIRKIVNQEIHDQNKKDDIFKKIAALQSEVDRDRTTLDAAFSRVIDLSKTLGEVGQNIEPLVEKMERIKKLFWDNSEKVNLLPKKERPKLISESPKRNSVDHDEIPF